MFNREILISLFYLFLITCNAFPDMDVKPPKDSSAFLLSGQWRNDLGSQMQTTAHSNGVLTGTYNTARGNASGEYPLYGSYNRNAVGTTLGFCVAWTNKVHGDSQSETCWTGFLRKANEIQTMWVLTQTPTTPTDEWKVNQINTNVFRKV